MAKDIGDLICGKPRHEAIKADPEKVRVFTTPARPQVLPDRVLEQRHCTACGSTLVVNEIVVDGADV